ncbi:MAG: hypothetical protein CL678_02095 [Bdellovibrionaceae bacterium]|nr:hypothetical protein [Pseudobdellovibrionaceae bacterium]|tara:strand:+ start:7788 stop:8831 length:1044 start_codon:yes stop_codon:yes gene_type:complete
MIFQVEIERPSAFKFDPAFAPIAAPVMKIYAGAGGALTTTITLTPEKTTRGVSEIVDRHTLKLTTTADLFSASPTEEDLEGHTGDLTGRWFFMADGLAQVPVHVASFDAETDLAHLADPLPENAVGGLGLTKGILTTGTYTTEIAAGALGAAVNRAAYYRVEYTFDPDGTGAADKGTQPRYFSQAGRIRVVRTRFATGLTHGELLMRAPQLSTARPPNRQSWQSFIDSVDMISRVESYLPNAFADNTLGEQWLTAHCWYVLAHAARMGLVPNVDAETAERLAHEEMARQVARVHWVDLDDDGETEAAELNFNQESRVGISSSSGATTGADYTSGVRYQPVLNDENDR